MPSSDTFPAKTSTKNNEMGPSGAGNQDTRQAARSNNRSKTDGRSACDGSGAEVRRQAGVAESSKRCPGGTGHQADVGALQRICEVGGGLCGGGLGPHVGDSN